MTSNACLAFAHPIERASASAPGDALDRISVRNHVREVEIGAFQTERGTLQRVRFDVVVEVQPADAPLDDDVDRILSYDRVTEAIAHELAAERLNLLETLADRIAARILAEPQAMRAFVRIQKLDRGPFDLGVEIERRRAITAPLPEEAAPRPRVVYLSNAAIAAPHLSGWLDQLSGRDAPVILSVGPPDSPAPRTGHAMTQRRVDLLAIEQNAWVLAARDPRCVVVETRTELDWAMKKGRISVWAPSKIVLDAVDGPAAGPDDPVALARWFAGEFNACDLALIGTGGAGAVPADRATL